LEKRRRSSVGAGLGMVACVGKIRKRRRSMVRGGGLVDIEGR
jgi:hypothetical protein